MTPQWLHPTRCKPPHKVTHPEKLEQLIVDFQLFGWMDSHPHLVGYRVLHTIQLLSGSHRWAAARVVGIDIPVVVVPHQQVWDAWGDVGKWKTLMQLGDTYEVPSSNP